MAFVFSDVIFEFVSQSRKLFDDREASRDGTQVVEAVTVK